MAAIRAVSGGTDLAHRVDAARRCADLLAALARTANVRLALSETGISACWAYKRRKADPDFDSRWRTAVRGGRRALARKKAAMARDPKASLDRLDKLGTGFARDERFSKLTIVGSSGKGTIRLERAKPTSFTEARRAEFIDALRATCNVRAAAKATGISPRGAYDAYHADAALRAAWHAVLAEGKVHLEMALIGAGRALLEGQRGEARPVVGADDIKGMDAKVALQVLRSLAPRDAAGRVRGRWVKPADAEATRREILAKVAAVRAARGRDPGPEAGAGGRGAA